MNNNTSILNIITECLAKGWKFSAEDKLPANLSLEQLFQLNLTARGSLVSLDNIAKSLYSSSIGLDSTPSFVEESSLPKEAQETKNKLKKKLEVVKFVIAYKKARLGELTERAKLQKEVSDLKDALTEKLEKTKKDSLEAKSPEEIQAQITALQEKLKSE